MAYMRLGDLLMASGVITKEQLDQALDSIRQKYGSKAVMRGSFLEEKKPPKATPYD